MNNLDASIIDGFRGRKVVVVGDVVADQYLQGSIARVSREAPVFILRHDQTETFPGSAANAAANVASLGGRASMIGVVGDDETGSILREKLINAGIDDDGLIIASDTRTTTKVRVLAGHPNSTRQQVIRIDYENSQPTENAVIERLIASINSICGSADAVIFSDYGYGVGCEQIFNAVRTITDLKGIPLLIDSRFDLQSYRGGATATPNREEAEKILGVDLTDEDAENLRARLQLRALLITNGSKGMSLYEAGQDVVHIPAIGSTTPVDVTGAGDTVIAAYALALSAGLNYRDAAVIADHAGGLVVMKRGTATISPEELKESISNFSFSVSEMTTTHS